MDGKPQPINPALANILARSKKVMNQVEQTKPTSRGGNVSESYENNYSETHYNEKDEREPIYEQFSSNNQGIPEVLGPIDYNEDIVRNSKLPQNIKDLMIAHPIKQVSLSNTTPMFTNEQIAMIKGNMGVGDIPQKKQQVQQLNENNRPINSSDMITLSKSELKEMINEGISTFFKQVYDKTLTEETIKKTINLLIKEGKIGVKKKI